MWFFLAAKYEVLGFDVAGSAPYLVHCPLKLLRSWEDLCVQQSRVFGQVLSITLFPSPRFGLPPLLASLHFHLAVIASRFST
jgi:hypothetical protein